MQQFIYLLAVWKVIIWAKISCWGTESSILCMWKWQYCMHFKSLLLLYVVYDFVTSFCYSFIFTFHGICTLLLTANWAGIRLRCSLAATLLRWFGRLRVLRNSRVTCKSRGTYVLEISTAYEPQILKTINFRSRNKSKLISISVENANASKSFNQNMAHWLWCVVYNIYCAYFSREGIYGVRGEYYEYKIAFRHFVMMISETYQAYVSSLLVHDRLINGAYAMLLFVYGVSIPVIWRRNIHVMVSRRATIFFYCFC